MDTEKMAWSKHVLPSSSSPVLVPEDTACCRPWRPCCCSRSCARRPPACASASTTPAPTCCATTRWPSGSGAWRTSRVTQPWTAGGPCCSPRSISPHPPPLLLLSPAGKKGLQVPQTTASWAVRSSEGWWPATAAKGTGGAGWPCPWTSRPTSWTSSLMSLRPKRCEPRRRRTRSCWLRLEGESEHVEQLRS